MPFPLIPLLVAAAPSLIDAGVKIAGQVKKNQGGAGPSTPATSTGAPRGSGSPSWSSSASPASTARPWPGKPTLPAMDDEQRASLRAIAAVVQGADLPGLLGRARPALAIAWMVNAWHESRLRPGAHNPGTPERREDSVGLFQINLRVHRAYSAAELVDPVTNTRALLALLVGERARFEDLLGRGGTVADLTGAVTLWVERPADTMAKARERARTAIQWFPEVNGRAALGLA